MGGLFLRNPFASDGTSVSAAHLAQGRAAYYELREGRQRLNHALS